MKPELQFMVAATFPRTPVRHHQEPPASGEEEIV
jgi:hypothetical protein